MDCIGPENPRYNDARKIANARFNYKPATICYCESAGDVQTLLRQWDIPRAEVRVRSGGHHHEGMCSGDGTKIIDVSKIAHIQFDTARNRVKIGAGAALKDIYAAVKARQLLFPGGGCGSVHVGGLVQGGGWGPYLRKMGLTCDRLIGFQMVTSKTQRIEVSDRADDPHRELLWAVRGGGGGNFGVITEFQFQLDPSPPIVTGFTIDWDQQNSVVPVVEEWRTYFPDADRALTSFCRVTVTGPPSKDVPVLIGGSFLGKPAELRQLLEKLLPTTFSKRHDLQTDPPLAGASEAVLTKIRPEVHPHYQPGPPPAAVRKLAATEGSVGDLSDTCAAQPFPHKVSSAFPTAAFGKASVEALANWISRSQHLPDARLYLSLHCLGGAARDKSWSAFAFRDRPFLLQYQAWWADPNDHALGKACIEWIHGFRRVMDSHTSGAFINFPDKDLVPDPNTPQGRKDLLTYYYGAKNLEKLIGIKRFYDPENVFRFGMSLPRQ